MQPRVIRRILGLLLCIFSITMLPPAAIGWLYQDGGLQTFAMSSLILLIAGALLLIGVERPNTPLRLRDGYLIVVLFWTVLGLAGAVPLLVSEYPTLSVPQAIFESLSGLTTTGATVIVGLDYLPKSVLFYRQELQWLGGMGIVVLAIAILPALGIGGMQLFRAETSGLQKDSKLTPRIAQTAKALWLIYLSLTVACALAYWLAGMDAFDAVGHAFSTVAIGGFSTHDQSLGFFDSRWIEVIAVVFMFLAGINFGLHFLAWRDRSWRIYRRDDEFANYALFLLALCAIVVIGLWISADYAPLQSVLIGVFHAVSLATTTGFTTVDHYNWAGSLPFILLCASFVGGCAGSTGGGLKVVRVMLLLRQGMRELTRMVHPHARLTVKVGRARVSDRLVEVVWGFFSAYVGLFILFMAVLLTLGVDQITAFSALAACMNNLGPGLGAVGPHYAEIDGAALIVLSLAMLLGRLEIFTLLVLFTPAFWRK